MHGRLTGKAGRLASEPQGLFVAQSGSGVRSKSSSKIANTSSLCVRALRTAVRGQGYPLPGGRKGPAPLRSEEHPLGLLGIEHTSPPDAAQVGTANCLYEFKAERTETLTTNNIMWCVEKARSSLMWWVLASQAVAKKEKVSFVYFRHCAYGGEEPKWSALLQFPGDSFAILVAKCPGVSITHPRSTGANFGREVCYRARGCAS